MSVWYKGAGKYHQPLMMRSAYERIVITVISHIRVAFINLKLEIRSYAHIFKSMCSQIIDLHQISECFKTLTYIRPMCNIKRCFKVIV